MDAFDKSGRSVAGTTFAPEYVAATIALAEGAVSPELVKTTFGWHIIKLDSINVANVEDQLATARTAAFEEWAPSLVSKYPVTYAVQPTETTVPAPTTEAPIAPTAALAGYPTDTPEPAATATVPAPSPTMTPTPTKQP
jgi:hypothetical protein